MPPSLAVLLWAVLLLALLRFDPARDSRTSWALWIPIAWMFFEESRLPSQWLQYKVASMAQALEQGNSTDRGILSILMLLALVVLLYRSFRWGKFFTSNLALTAFLLLALVSVVWSDFTLIALKRWFRDLGDYLVLLVVMTDDIPLEALRTFLRRLFYLLIPLSIVLIKYFTQLGMQYNPWNGAPEYIGVATSKNMLGAVCMLSGIFFFWDILTRWSDRKEWRTKKIILLDISFFAMSLWLLHVAQSATSTVCLAIGCLVIAVAQFGWGRRHSWLTKWLIPGLPLLYLFVAFGLGLSGDVNAAVGRSANFTDRTVIWNAVLNTHTNPLIGTGYQSFWLGPRIQQVWRNSYPGINETHNGYLDIYVNLGVIGLFALGALLVSSYRRICRTLGTSSKLASLAAGLLTVALFYNLTEAAFDAAAMCLMFLLFVIVVPKPADSPELAIGELRPRVPIQGGAKRAASGSPAAGLAGKQLPMPPLRRL